MGRAREAAYRSLNRTDRQFSEQTEDLKLYRRLATIDADHAVRVRLWKHNSGGKSSGPVPNSPVTGRHFGSGDRGGIVAVVRQCSPSLLHLLSRAARRTRSEKFRTMADESPRRRARFKTAAGRSLGSRRR